MGVGLLLDFVLVWEIRSRRKRRGKGKTAGEEEEQAEVKVEKSRSERRKAQMAQWREKFVQNLESAGLLMEKVLHIRLHMFQSCSLLLFHRHSVFLLFPAGGNLK